jgi:NADPH:quinone reductase
MSPIAPASLMPGSKTLSGFWLADCMSPSRLPDMLLRPLRELLELVASGQLAPVAAESFPLERAADAHRALLSRATMGKVIRTM